VGEERRSKKAPKHPSPLDRLSAWDGPVNVRPAPMPERTPAPEQTPSPAFREPETDGEAPASLDAGAAAEADTAAEADAATEAPPAARPSTGSSVRRTEYRSRTERRMARRAKRRRKMVTRLGLVVGPMLVVIAAIVVLFALLGGPEADPGVVTTLPVDGAGGSESRSALLVIEQEDAVPLLILLYPREEGGTALAMPGLTLLKTVEGFKTLAELHLSDRDAALRAGLVEALGVSIDQVASVEWSAVRDAMQRVVVDELPPPILASGEGESEQVAGAVLELAGAGVSDEGEGVWDGLPLEGDAGEFRKTVSELAATISGGGWTAAALTGKMVEGRGFKYLEPDVETAKAALAGTVLQVDVVLQVQNGSGVLGVAQEASGLLASLGYTMMPVGNSKDFPDVVRTRIEVASDAAVQAAKVRALLGIGTIEVDPTLEPGHIVVVLGKDYIPPQTTVAATAG
jgi:hypothetical protein